MNKKCTRCKQVISADDFLCPHCGAIQGEAPAHPISAMNETKRPPLSRMLPWICAAFAVVVILFAGIMLWNGYQNALPPTTTSTQPHPTQTTAPLVAYEVQIKNAANRVIQDVHIDVYLGSEIVYSCDAGQQGKATFILPQSDGYHLKLSNLPVPYSYTYADLQFFFPDGQQALKLVLEKKDVPYTVKVVNEAGEPIKDVLIDFGVEHLLTDQNGICTHYQEFQYSGRSVRVLSAPTGYYSTPVLVRFLNDSIEVEIILQKVEDVVLADGLQFYTLSIVDEFGDPVAGQCFGYTTRDDFHMLEFSFYTNAEGFAVFAAPAEKNISIGIVERPDYYGMLYPYEDGSTHQQIQLKLHETEFTYSIGFGTADEQPVPGVQIQLFYSNSDNRLQLTSDENGMIVFQSTEANPENILFDILSIPDGYVLTDPLDGPYSFPASSRTTAVLLDTQPTITLVDELGQPIAGAQLRLRDPFDFFEEQTATTNENGQCVFELPADWTLLVEIISLPEGYDHLFFVSKPVDGTQREFIIEPDAVRKTYHVYLKDSEGNPVPNTFLRLYLHNGDLYTITTDNQGYGQFFVWKDASVDIQGISFDELPEKWAGYDDHSIEYGEENCIFITISSSQISG